MKAVLARFLPILLLLLAALGSLSEVFLNPGYVGRSWDWGQTEYPGGQWTLLVDSIFVWQDFFFGGRESPFNSLVFFQLISFVLAWLTDVVTGPKLLMAGLLFGSGWGMLRLLLKYEVHSWVATGGALLYMFNPRTLTLFIGGHLFQTYLIAYLPWMLLHLGNLKKDERFSHLLWIVLGIFFTNLLTNSLIVIFAVALLPTLLVLVQSREKGKFTGKLVLAGVFFLAVNLFWLAPFVMALLNPQGYVVHQGYSLAEELRFRLASLDRTSWAFTDLFALVNRTGMDIEYANHFDGGWLENARRVLGVASFALIGWAYLGKKRGLNFLELVSLLHLVIGLFLIAGTNNELGKLFYQVYAVKAGMIFSAFSNLWRYSPILLVSWAFLAATSVERLWNSHRLWRLPLGVYGLAFLALYLYPWFGADLTRPLIKRGSQPMNLKMNRIDEGDLVTYERFRRDRLEYRVMQLPPPAVIWPGNTKYGFVWNYTTFSKPAFFEYFNVSPFYNQTIKQIYTHDPQGNLSESLALGNVLYLISPQYEEDYKEVYVELNPGVPTNYLDLEKENLERFRQKGQLVLESGPTQSVGVNLFRSAEFLPRLYSPGAAPLSPR